MTWPFSRIPAGHAAPPRCAVPRSRRVGWADERPAQHVRASLSTRSSADSRGLRAAVFAGLLALGTLVYGPRVLNAGFAWDDWEKAGEALFWSQPGALGPLDLREALYEPGLALLLPLPHLAFGDHPALHLALAMVLGVVMSWCVYLVSRELGAPPTASAMIAALSLLFPWSDSVRLWATAGVNQVSVSLLLVGVVLALRGLAEPPSRASRLRRWSLAAYVASMLSYPVTPVLVAATTLLYGLRAPWRRAWEWGREDLAAAVVIGLYVRFATTKPVQSVGDQLEHARTILDELGTLLARAIVPFGHLPRGLVWAGAAAIALAGWVALRRDAAPAAGRERLRVGLSLLGGGLALSVIAYLIFVPGEAKYHPLAQGIYNRAGIAAGPGVAAAIVGLACIAGALVTGRRASRLATSFPVIALVVVVGAGWIGRVRADIDLWSRAATESDNVLAALDDRRLAIPDDAVVFTVGHPHAAGPGVPVFGASFDLDAAIKIRRGRQTPHAYPLDVPFACGSRAAVPVDSRIRDLPSPAYGRLWVVDVERRHAWRIRSPGVCTRVRSEIASRIEVESLEPTVASSGD